MILYPIDVEEEEQPQPKQLKETWKSIKERLDDMKEGEDIVFEQLLLNLYVSVETYLLAIRSSFNSLTIFLTRQTSELRINKYKGSCLSNMDIQMFLMFMHVPCVSSLTSQKLKLLVMKPEKEIQVLMAVNGDTAKGFPIDE